MFTDQLDFDPSLPGSTANISADYEAWLARGKKLAEGHHRSQWDVGDWLVEGRGQYDFAADIPKHLLLHKNRDSSYRSEKVPNFYKDIAVELGFHEQTLKNLAHVAQAFKPEDRFTKLTFAHHAEVAGYERAAEYLAACLVEGGRPKTVAWLRKHVEQNENVKTATYSEGRYLYIHFPDKLYAKLKDLGKYYDKKISELIETACHESVERYLERESKNLSLKFFDYWEENRWPFDKAVVEEEKAKRKPRGRRKAIALGRFGRNGRRRVA